MADAMMEFLGEANGVKWYWAEPGRFEKPGVYYWNGSNNVLCVPYRAAPGSPAVAQVPSACAYPDCTGKEPSDGDCCKTPDMTQVPLEWRDWVEGVRDDILYPLAHRESDELSPIAEGLGQSIPNLLEMSAPEAPTQADENGCVACVTCGQPAQAAPAVAQVPPSYKLVPVEPTEEMLTPPDGMALDQTMAPLWRRGRVLTWQDMLAAAPEAPAQAAKFTQADLNAEYARGRADGWEACVNVMLDAPNAPAQAAPSAGEVEAMRNALRSIREHCAVQPSALAKSIVVTCDAALSHKEQP